MNHTLIQIIIFITLKKNQYIIIIINDVKIFFRIFFFLKSKKINLVKFFIQIVGYPPPHTHS